MAQIECLDKLPREISARPALGMRRITAVSRLPLRMLRGTQDNELLSVFNVVNPAAGKRQSQLENSLGGRSRQIQQKFARLLLVQNGLDPHGSIRDRRTSGGGL